MSGTALADFGSGSGRLGLGGWHPDDLQKTARSNEIVLVESRKTRLTIEEIAFNAISEVMPDPCLASSTSSCCDSSV